MAPQLLSERRGQVASCLISRILSRIRRPATIIPLGAALLTRSSDLPGGCGNCLTRLGAPDRHATTAWVWPRIPSLFGLAPCGVYPAFDFTAEAVRSYRTFSPLPCAFRPRRYLLCGTSRLQALTPESRTLSGTLSCGVRTFLPRNAKHSGSDRLATPAVFIVRQGNLSVGPLIVYLV
jgi:hypothetical protein